MIRGLCKIVLTGYREFNSQHNAQNISHKIHHILSYYGLINKVFPTSFDNASFNKANLESPYINLWIVY